ncbi:hypothetical protein [Brevibacterium aurantiacum]|uniref:Uncharacterized protein n=1 Tax=Brevibacterium aurantiacum TaxID=273384 RepID=A0A2H1HUZ4_BREAU|nr:hypothetical protein [Brevibacterium aurantiacum]SMX66763.1 hypothetical protein BAUR920_00287 [Brevibacterium aurantiacum]
MGATVLIDDTLVETDIRAEAERVILNAGIEGFLAAPEPHEGLDSMRQARIAHFLRQQA